MRGIQGSFHRCANTLLPFLIDSLSDNKLPTGLLFEVLVQTVTDILSCIHYTKCEIFWSTMFESIDSYIKSQNDDESSKGLEYVLKLVGQAVEHKQGKFVTKPGDLINRLMGIINGNFSESILIIVSQICVLILTSENITLLQENASRITLNMLAVKQPNILLHFVENSIMYTQFDILILPQFLKYCIKTEVDEKCLKILAQICLKKSPLCVNGLELNKWRKYNINMKSEEIYEKNYEYISVLTLEHVYENIDNILCVLICLPHLNHNANEVKSSCKNMIKLILDKLKPNSDAMDVDRDANTITANVRTDLFLLGMTLECAIHIDSDSINDYLDIHELVDVILPYTTSLEYLQALNILDLALTASSIDLNNVDINMFNKLHDVLVLNLSSPHHKIRLITTHIYTLFNYLPDFNNCDLDNEQPAFFTIMNTVENITPSVHQYREQLQYLNKLNFDNIIITNLNDVKYKQLALRYLLGVLYMNFKLLWDPTIEIIATYASGLEPAQFWTIFCEQLENSIANSNSSKVTLSTVGTFDAKYMLIQDLYSSFYEVDDKPDFVNYRILLWKAMSHFTDLCEAKNRSIAEMLLNFMQ